MGYVQDIMLPGNSQGLLQGLSCGLPRAPCMEQGLAEQPQAHATELLGSGVTHRTKTCISSVPSLYMMMMMTMMIEPCCDPAPNVMHTFWIEARSPFLAYSLLTQRKQEREQYFCVLLYHTFNTPRLLRWKSHGITTFAGKADFLLSKKSSR